MLKTMERYRYYLHACMGNSFIFCRLEIHIMYGRMKAPRLALLFAYMYHHIGCSSLVYWKNRKANLYSNMLNVMKGKK